MCFVRKSFNEKYFGHISKFKWKKFHTKLSVNTVKDSFSLGVDITIFFWDRRVKNTKS